MRVLLLGKFSECSNRFFLSGTSSEFVVISSFRITYYLLQKLQLLRQFPTHCVQYPIDIYFYFVCRRFIMKRVWSPTISASTISTFSPTRRSTSGRATFFNTNSNQSINNIYQKRYFKGSVHDICMFLYHKHSNFKRLCISLTNYSVHFHSVQLVEVWELNECNLHSTYLSTFINYGVLQNILVI